MFMKPQIIRDRWFKCETTHGTEFVQQDLIGKTTRPTKKELEPYLEGKLESVSVLDGYGARLSAPGYLDCTEWLVFDTKEEAKAHLIQMYTDDDCEEDNELEKAIEAL